MKKMILSLATMLSSVALFSFVSPNKQDSDYAVSVEASKIEWVGSKAEGYHPGTFNLKSGVIKTAAGKLTGGSFVIDLTSLKVTDESGEKLAGHLKAKDFFDVENNKEATYEISSVKYKNEKTASVKGFLTIKGLKVAVDFDATIRNASEKKFFAQASFNISRAKLGLAYGAGKINDDVQITVYLFGSK